MPTFNQLIHAARCGFTYDTRTGLFFRFTHRSDRGYDVDVSIADAIPSFAPHSPVPVQIDSDTLTRLLLASPDLHRAIVEESNDRRWGRLTLVLNEHGHLRGVVPEPKQVLS